MLPSGIFSENHMQRTAKLGGDNEKFVNVKAICVYSNHFASKF
jgi:hypothetical protein